MTSQRAALCTMVAVLVLAVAWGLTSVLGLTPQDNPSLPPPPAPAEERGEAEAARVLEAWDLERSRAWASGDADGLGMLYVAGSGAATADVAMLRRWTQRGFVVRHLRTQVLRLRVLQHDPNRWVLDVTDRVVGGEAVGRSAVVALPNDAATRRRVSLRRRGGKWLVSEVSTLR